MNKRIFLKGESDCEKDITIECEDPQAMSIKEFRDVTEQVSRSHISYACSSTSVSAQEAERLCKLAGFNCEYAHDMLRKQYGRLWNYTGD